MDHLVEVMHDAYSFVEEAEPLNKVESHRRVIERMEQQTIDCAYFIRDYASNKNFCMLISPLYADRSHHYFNYQGNESSKTVSYRTLIAKSNITKTSSKVSKSRFKSVLMLRPESLSLAFCTISIVSVSAFISFIVLY